MLSMFAFVIRIRLYVQILETWYNNEHACFLANGQTSYTQGQKKKTTTYYWILKHFFSACVLLFFVFVLINIVFVTFFFCRNNTYNKINIDLLWHSLYTKNNTINVSTFQINWKQNSYSFQGYPTKTKPRP